VLIVEDNVEVSKLMREVLEDAGYEVDVTHDAASGLFAAAEFQPDLITVDYLMPGGNGDTLVHALREHAVFRHVPVLGVSARMDVTALFLGGICDFLPKPFDAETLLARVAGLIDYCRIAECPCGRKFSSERRS
jgi:DNA-binding response OmpR family regulator